MPTITRLVRDKMPERFKGQRDRPRFHEATEDEYKVKLREELGRAMGAFISDSTLDNLAEIAEVILAIGEAESPSKDEIEQRAMLLRELCSSIRSSTLVLEERRRRMLAERGGFLNKVIMESTTAE